MNSYALKYTIVREYEYIATKFPLFFNLLLYYINFFQIYRLIFPFFFLFTFFIYRFNSDALKYTLGGEYEYFGYNMNDKENDLNLNESSKSKNNK